MEISKSDWKLFRARIAEWQENYMERLVKEYIDMLNSGVIKTVDLEGFSDELRKSVDFLLHR